MLGKEVELFHAEVVFVAGVGGEESFGVLIEHGGEGEAEGIELGRWEDEERAAGQTQAVSWS